MRVRFILAFTVLAAMIVSGGFASASPRLTAFSSASAPQPQDGARALDARHSLTDAAAAGAYVGPADRSTTFAIAIELRGQHLDEIPSMQLAQADPHSMVFHRWITPQQYGQYFGAPKSEVEKTIAYLEAHGFQLSVAATNQRFLLMRAPVGTVETMFDTPIDVRRQDGVQYFANRYAPTIPAGLNWIASVQGLDTYHRVHTHLAFAASGLVPRPQATVIPGQFAFGPQDLYTAYDYNASYNGAGTTVAIPVVRNFLPSDVFNYDSQFGLSNLSYDRVFLTGTCAQPCPSATSPNDATETALDTEVVHASAQLAKEDVVSAGDDLASSLVLDYEYIADVLGNSVQVVSNSYGLCEPLWDPTERDAVAASIDQGVLEGQTWFDASGDDGADDCGNAYKSASVDVPGDIPDVVAVGGTSLNPPIEFGNVQSYGNEWTWNDSNCGPNIGGATGGGRSESFPKPTWQLKVTVDDGDRDVPDVAAESDPYQQTAWPSTCPATGGYWIDYALNWSAIGGTSAAAPLWAGIGADLAGKELGSLGLILPELYKLKGSSSYHQITVGNNTFNGVTGFDASAGYNLVTGLGTPDESKLLAQFSQALPPTPQPTSFPSPQPHPSQTPASEPTTLAVVPVYSNLASPKANVAIIQATTGAGMGNVLATLKGAYHPVDVAFNAGHTQAAILELGGYVDTVSLTSLPYKITVHAQNLGDAPLSGIALTDNDVYATDYRGKDLRYLPLAGGAVHTIALSYDPTSIVWNAFNDELYVTDGGSGHLEIIDSTTNAFKQILKVGTEPTRVAINADGTRAYVANSGDGTVTPVNVSGSPALLDKPVFVGGEPTSVTVAPDDKLAFVTNLFCPGPANECDPDGDTSNGVVEILLLTKSPIGVECCIVVGQEPIDASLDASGRYLWVINQGSNDVSIVDTFTNTVLTPPVTLGSADYSQFGASGRFVNAIP
jgi:YVTN family beta-propeller protein